MIEEAALKMLETSVEVTDFDCVTRSLSVLTALSAVTYLMGLKYAGVALATFIASNDRRISSLARGAK